jgi:hypothetical protein
MTRLRALTVADALVGVAILSLIGSLLWPMLTQRRFTDAVDETIVLIDGVRERAILTHRRTGEWPSRVDTGPIDDAPTLEWRVWNRVDQIEVPPAAPPPDADPGPSSAEPVTASVVRSFGAIEVTTTSEPLLAALLDHYGRTDSFVRDDTWTLVLQP